MRYSMPIALCPTRDRLALFDAGRLPAGDFEEVADHVSQCPTCESALADVDFGDDPFVRQIRFAAALADHDSDAMDCATAVSRFKAVCSLSIHSATGGAEPAEPLPQSIGPYRILGPLGHGGMGTVYLAAHRFLMRNVAIKVLRPKRDDDPTMRARFRREMAALGQLQHPHVVQAIDAGENEGMLYLVMEYIDGPSVAHLATRENPLAVADACEIARQAALALDFAHRQGLVHRDVKPSNLMVSRRGVVKLVDLGLAAFSAHVSPDDTRDLTQSQVVLGTYEFMAPEQWADPRSADGRADVYSLGCTLYYLLTGASPFGREAYDTPAKKLIAHANTAAAPPSTLRHGISPALDVVVNKMLAKQPADRFSSAQDIAEALSEHCRGADLEQIVARHAGRMTSELTASPATSTAKLGAMAAAEDTRRVVEAEPMSAKLDARTTRRTGLRNRKWLVLFVAGATCAAIVAAVVSRMNPASGTLVVEAERPSGNVQLRILGPTGATVYEVAGVLALDLEAGDYDLELKDDADALRLSTTHVTITPGDRQIVRIVGSIRRAGSGSSTGPVKATASAPQVEPAKRVRVARERSPIVKDAPLSAAALVSQPAALPGVASWTIETRQPRSAVRAARFSPSGAHLASGEECGTIRVWNYPSLALERILLGHADAVLGLTWSPDGQYLASVGRDATVRIWDVAGGELVRTFIGHEGAISCVCWSPDGETIASGGYDMTVRLWKPATGEAGRVLRGHTARLTAVDWSPVADVLASGQKQKNLVMVWNPTSGQVISNFKVEAGEVWTTEWSPDGQLLAIGNGGQTTWLWDVANAERRGVLLGQGGNLTSVAWSRDGRKLASASWGPWLRVWDVDTQSIVHTFVRDPGTNSSAAFSVDWLAGGDVIASGEQLAGVRLWNAVQGQPLAQLLARVRLKSTEATLGQAPRDSAEAIATVLVAPQGNFDGPEGCESELAFVAQIDARQEWFDATTFTRRFGWQNNSAAARGR